VLPLLPSARPKPRNALQLPLSEPLLRPNPQHRHSWRCRPLAQVSRQRLHQSHLSIRSHKVRSSNANVEREKRAPQGRAFSFPHASGFFTGTSRSSRSRWRSSVSKTTDIRPASTTATPVAPAIKNMIMI
jgi:hypothetical protein